MNINDLTTGQMDDLASDYLNGMYESQYDESPTDEELEEWKKENNHT